MHDERPFMMAALRMAERGLGFVSPNPPVGAIAVHNGRVVARGFHALYGGPHAEAALIASAAPEQLRGADVFVTLEPCAHHGKTPPCADALIRAGVRRVVYAAPDPNPLAHGQGPERLRAAGVVVDSGLCAEESRWLLAPFYRWILTRRPLVTAKWAMTADGRIATRSRDSEWVSSPAMRARTRRERAQYDAIIIGSGTLLKDDPQLLPGRPGRRPLLRVVLDTHVRLSPRHRLAQTSAAAPVLLATVSLAHRPEVASRVDALRHAGVECLALPEQPDGRPDLAALLSVLGERGLSHVLCEGGATLHGAFLDGGLIDRVQFILAPKIVGGAEALGPVGGAGRSRMSEAQRLTHVRVRRSGGDWHVTGALTRAGSGNFEEPSR